MQRHPSGQTKPGGGAVAARSCGDGGEDGHSANSWLPSPVRAIHSMNIPKNTEIHRCHLRISDPARAVVRPDLVVRTGQALRQVANCQETVAPTNRPQRPVRMPDLMIRAGLPATIDRSGTSLVTTLPAATMQ